MNNDNDKAAPDINRRKEIRDEIKTIGNRSTWLLGFVIVITLALGGLLFASYGMPPPENEMTDFFRIGRATALILFSFYLLLIPFYLWQLIVSNLRKPIYQIHETEELHDIFENLAKHFKMLVALFIIAVPVSFISGIGTWHFYG